MGLLRHGRALVSNALREEEQRLQEHRSVLMEVHQVLDEMVYDVETCEHECELARARHELRHAQATIAEYQKREADLIQERQQAYEFAEQVKLHGREVMQRLTENLDTVMLELAKKEAIEQELAQAKEQLQLAAQMSKELVAAQREIQELRRQHSIQRMLTGTSVEPSPSSTSGPRARSAVLQPSPPPSSASSASSQNEQDRGNTRDALVSCTDKLLTNVFAHLDANSVFAVSLTSRGLLRRVHVIFGMPTPNVLLVSSSSSISSTTASSKAKQSVSQQRGIQPHPQHELIAVAATPLEMPASARYAMKGRSQSGIVSASSDKGRAQLARAEQIVKSLNKDEMKLFHDMSTRVKTLESHLGHVQAEKEDVAARLLNAESVRDFLMDKLKDLEDRLSQLMDVSRKKEAQASIDREIIGFLDAKSQEDEITLKSFVKHNDAIRIELERVREEHAAKITIVNDMVGLLSDEKQDLELQLRSQRKVLVREVKNLRAHSQQLETERNHYFAQLRHLRQALRHLDELS